ncbi:MAG: type VI secretion system baseplate subunit TssF [Neisseria sp.]|uniref:type VI secretion system baseplate subunit TssF n=1 Tax=Neisseria sp. TaxID=192066 RepID=UPI0026DC98EB|nr:type VI secretion system baseplate subunit TssF [Neisseria sp.]MDO4640972.1 type VI secretion system baseplate subunit TssF [Neisseria sp.]
MNSKLLSYYNRELAFLKEMGKEFAKSYPKVASRLALDTTDIPDPYVERLLEGVGFLTARTQLKLDAEYPRFVQRILEIVYPDFTSQKPASAIVNLQPNGQQGDVINRLERGRVLRSLFIDEYKVNCPFSVTKTIDILPLKIEKAKYTDSLGYLPGRLNLLRQASGKIQSALRLDFSLSVSGLCSEMLPNVLPLYLGSDLSKASSLLFLLASECAGVVCHSYESPKQWCYPLKSLPEHVGFNEDEALTFNLDKSVSAFRILQEYADLPEKFLFIAQKGMKEAIARAEKEGHVAKVPEQLEEVVNDKGVNKKLITYSKRYFSLSFLFTNKMTELMELVGEEDFALNAVPVVNLFRKKSARFPVNMQDREHHVVIDRTQPLNYEVHSIEQVKGFDANNRQTVVFAPMYQAPDMGLFPEGQTHHAYFSARRTDRLPSDSVLKNGYRTSYLGSEIFLSLADNTDCTFNSGIEHLSVDAWCTSRDLPLLMPRDGASDFLIEGALPVKSIKLISKLTRPKTAPSEDQSLWPFLNQLSLNYCSLLNIDEDDAPTTLKALLSAFVSSENDLMKKQIDSIIRVETAVMNKVVRYHGTAAPVRGIRLVLTLDDALLGGIHPFLFGSVLNHYFRRLVSMNSFIQLQIDTLQQGRIATWPTVVGERVLL